MDYDINYLDFKGGVAETINYKNIIDFEKEIQECFNIGRPINFKYAENEQELER